MTASAAAGYTATAQAQEKPEDKPPANIWEAAAKGDVEAIKGFLANDNKIDDQNKNGYSILHIAVRSGQAAVAEFALANGAEAALMCGSGSTIFAICPDAATAESLNRATESAFGQQSLVQTASLPGDFPKVKSTTASP